MKLLNKAHLAITGLVLLIGAATLNAGAVHAIGEGFWHTQGSQIKDSNGQTVVIKGVNWFGLETESMAPHGLWTRNYKEMMNQMKSLGFNTIRLPYSNQALESGAKTNGIDFSKNSDLNGLSPIEVMDKIVNYAGQIGLKVILDRHRPEAWGQSELWYTDKIPESRWISDWQMLARRFANNSAVIGADLHNEPHGSACWGCGNPSTDWKEAATRAGNAILGVNPNWLIIVEGVEQNEGQWYWWGGNLSGANTKPIMLNTDGRLVYSTHDYPNSVHTQSWLNAGNFPDNLPAMWDNMWGNIVKSGQAPILVGEFGTKLETESDKKWLAKLVEYMNNNGISWTFWCFNPNSGDTGGILADDWTSVRQDKMAILAPIIGSQPSQSNPVAVVTPSALPTVMANPPVTNNTGGVIVSYTTRDNWNNGYVMDMVVENNTNSVLTDWKVEWSKDSSQSIGEHWGINVTQGPNWVNASGADWSNNLAPGAKTSFGMVVNFTSSNPAFGGFKVVTGNESTPTAYTPSPTPTVAMPVADKVGGNTISIWWPTEGATVGGVQPLKAVVDNSEVSAYQMSWRVDGGDLNSMETSLTDSPHKEAVIDFSGWNWKGNGPYTIEVVAKNNYGETITSKSTNLFLTK
jgi:endoglucanase